jgi:hypothetical protein
MLVNFIYTFLLSPWGVKTGFTFAHQFFLLVSDGLGGVSTYVPFGPSIMKLRAGFQQNRPNQRYFYHFYNFARNKTLEIPSIWYFLPETLYLQHHCWTTL